MVVLGGWLIFDQVYPASSVLGAALAASAIVSYTAITLHEQARAKLHAKQGSEQDARSPKLTRIGGRKDAGCSQV